MSVRFGVRIVALGAGRNSVTNTPMARQGERQEKGEPPGPKQEAAGDVHLPGTHHNLCVRRPDLRRAVLKGGIF